MRIAIIRKKMQKTVLKQGVQIKTIRLRYKISVVIACFVVFYVGITPIGVACVDPANNCAFLTELVISTRLVVPGNAIIEYTGTAPGIEDPKFENFISQTSRSLP